MKKSTLFLSCIILLIACQKQSAVSKEPAENSGQVLSAIIKKTLFNSNLAYNEKILFEYDASGKLIMEGEKHYYRDEQGRIAHISLPPNNTNRREISVHYTDANSNMVAFTFCHFKAAGNRGEDSLSGYDSIVYVHDGGRLSKMLEYFSDNGINYTHYFTYNFTYDESGNIRETSKYKTDGSACYIYSYDSYDDKINPLYSNDEVRMLETFWNAGNISPNNLVKGNYIADKVFDYRPDGRPRSCTVKENGVDVTSVTYQYK